MKCLRVHWSAVMVILLFTLFADLLIVPARPAIAGEPIGTDAASTPCQIDSHLKVGNGTSWLYFYDVWHPADETHPGYWYPRQSSDSGGQGQEPYDETLTGGGLLEKKFPYDAFSANPPQNATFEVTTYAKGKINVIESSMLASADGELVIDYDVHGYFWGSGGYTVDYVKTMLWAYADLFVVANTDVLLHLTIEREGDAVEPSTLDETIPVLRNSAYAGSQHAPYWDLLLQDETKSPLNSEFNAYHPYNAKRGGRSTFSLTCVPYKPSIKILRFEAGDAYPTDNGFVYPITVEGEVETINGGDVAADVLVYVGNKVVYAQDAVFESAAVTAATASAGWEVTLEVPLRDLVQNLEENEQRTGDASFSLRIDVQPTDAAFEDRDTTDNTHVLEHTLSLPQGCNCSFWIFSPIVAAED